LKVKEQLTRLNNFGDERRMVKMVWSPEEFCFSGVESSVGIKELIPKHCKPKLFLTDPPYNMGFNYGPVDDSLEVEQYHDMLLKVFDAAYERADDDAHLFIINYPEIISRMWNDVIEPKNKNGSPRKKKYWKFKQWITWCYPNNFPPHPNKFTRASRAIIWLTKGNPQSNNKQIVQPYRNPWDKRVKGHLSSGKRGPALYDWWANLDLCKNVSVDKISDPRYSNQMPEMLLRRIIHITTSPGDLVADPFAGTFSTVRAALATSRLGWGCDLNKKTEVYHPSIEDYTDFYANVYELIEDQQFVDIDWREEPFDFYRTGLSSKSFYKCLIEGSSTLSTIQRVRLLEEIRRLENYSKSWNINRLTDDGESSVLVDDTRNKLQDVLKQMDDPNLRSVLDHHNIEHESVKKKQDIISMVLDVLMDKNPTHQLSKVKSGEENSTPIKNIERDFN